MESLEKKGEKKLPLLHTSNTCLHPMPLPLGAEMQTLTRNSYQFSDPSLTGLPPFSSSDSNDATADMSPRFNYQSLLHISGLSYVSPPDLSLLSLPPSGIHTMLLTAGLWGLDLSMDEEFHQADLIGKKYLQGTPSPATAAGEGVRKDPSWTDTSCIR